MSKPAEPAGNPCPRRLKFTLALVLATTVSAFGPWILTLGLGLAALVAGLWSLGGLENEKRNREVAERKLQERGHLADAIIAAIPSGLVGLDESGAVCRWNEGATRILGMGRGGMVGQHVDRWPIAGQRGLAALLKDALAGRTVTRGSLEVTRTDGKTIPLGISTSQLGGSGAQAPGAVAVFQDLTEARKLRARMKRQERLAAVGTLAASIAHEIRNPLASIAGSVELLSAELELDGENRVLLDLILKESDRLNALITDFLDFSREQRPDPVPLDPTELLREMFRMIRQRAEAGESLRLELEAEGAPTQVMGDPAMIRQLSLNLLLNACEAMEWAGTLRVVLTETEHEGRPCCEIAFADSGGGIGSEERAQIFEPFFTTKKGGTGLGLAIANRIAQLHGGQLELLDQEQPGSCFLFRIPTHGGVEAAERVEAAEPETVVN